MNKKKLSLKDNAKIRPLIRGACYLFLFYSKLRHKILHGIFLSYFLIMFFFQITPQHTRILRTAIIFHIKIHFSDVDFSFLLEVYKSIRQKKQFWMENIIFVDSVNMKNNLWGFELEICN